MLTGEPGSIVSVGAPPGHKLLPPGREANGWTTRPVRVCIGVKLQGLHRAPEVTCDRRTTSDLARRRGSTAHNPSPPVTITFSMSHYAHPSMKYVIHTKKVCPQNPFKPPLVSVQPMFLWKSFTDHGIPSNPFPSRVQVIPTHPCVITACQWSIYLKPIMKYAVDLEQKVLNSSAMCPLLYMCVKNSTTADLAYYCKERGVIWKGNLIH